MRTVLWGILVAVTSAWGADNVSPPRVDAVIGGPGVQEALKVLSTRCTGCHQPETPPGSNFLSAEKLNEKSTRDLLNAVIRKSKMPKAHRDFKNTKDGKTILKWLDAAAK